MDTLIEKFPAQLREAVEIGEAATISAHEFEIRKVFVAGMGGSGIGANFVAEFIKEECPLPYNIGKSYHIPMHIDKHTLTILSSYSGNTEETLECFDQIKERGSKIVIVSSGGKMIEIAKEQGLDFIQLPNDWPSPRACVGFSIVQQLFILNKLDIISNVAIQKVKIATDLINYDQDDIKIEAEKIAKILHNKIPIFYITDRMESVAVRARQQVNENAKMLSWHHVIPEMNHNELVGWTSKNDSLAVVFLRNSDDYPRNQTRIEINKEIVSKYCPTILEIYSKGNSIVERSFYFVHLVDWVSWYLSKLNNVDSIEIDVIDFLKSKLAKF